MIRLVVGSIIAIHGLIRIVDIGGYTDFILSNFKGTLPFDTLLVIGGALFPFLEFFTGLLICFNITLKKSIMVGFFISVVMSIFILVGNMYERLIYHTIVLIGLTFLLFKDSRSFANRKHFI
ncbi:hypothetical protein POV27_10705 [Aureisphaera galaxeae]|uniref:hypothetical protein n=1 Tax=Aureisphaera galaxeae TaxID=1538023 RepID=UPI0023503C40|nr:hypothetical protein [Aureisphaera galaxeae]MDC8004518.1 hypothetical protein [Aureisphaera galaxeae]